MTNRMRTDAFGFERRHRRARLPHRSSYQGVDTKPSQRLSETVQEHSFMWTTAAHQSLEQVGSLGPQRTVPSLVAFAYQTNGTRAAPRKITYRDLGGFVYARTGVVEELKHHVVARSLFGASIRRLQAASISGLSR